MLTIRNIRVSMKLTSVESKFEKGEEMEVGEKIKRYIEEKGISQVYISRKTGIAMPKLNLALNGNRRLTFPEYEMICWVLEVNTDKFLQPRMPDQQEGR